MAEEDPYAEINRVQQSIVPSSPAPTSEPEDPYGKLRQARVVVESLKNQPSKVPQTMLEQGADILGAGVAGIGRGVVSIPGIVGDIGQLYERSPAYAAWVQQRVQELRGKAQPGAAMEAYKTAIAPIEKRMSPQERAGMEYRIAGIPFPTGQKIVEEAAKTVPQIKYEGQTPTARVVGTVGEFFGGIPATSAATQ